MNLWQLEILRLIRTRRWMPVVGVLVISGLVSPPTARYFSAFLENFGPNGIKVTAPAATPAEGMREYVGNALQLGILSLVLVSASSIAFDAHPEIAVFMRSRVRSMKELILPKFAVLAGLAAAAFVIGALAAWYETELLLGSLPVGRTVIGIATGALFELFVVAVVVYGAGRSAGFIQTTVFAVVVIFTMPILENVDSLRFWLPSRLASNLLEADQARSFLDYVRPVLVTVILIPVLLALGIRSLDRREV
jgi:ABC-2 type transport system permease protein